MKVMKIEPNEKLVEFSQSQKQFRQDQPVSNDLRSMMGDVHRDFTKYMMEQHFDDVQSLLKEYIDDHHPIEEKRQALQNNLFWWKILNDGGQELKWNCTDGFIGENYHRFIDKPLITSWLREWDKAVTKFYYVGYKHSDRIFVVFDILEDKMLDVIVKDPGVVSPGQGEIVAGTLIPYGGGIYAPITDFYRFNYEAREAIGGTFRHHYDTYLKANSLPAAFIHVLSVMLQIERRIALKLQRIK
ncbi:hypothetical protein EV207_1575 [Scopulibacillus darangshiensis]|uniref:Uncharacterized protein n=1 Tax=Scopulibacillus darangshiensis TaxID=442528 RepID=A0A4R2NF61_9BACL|nr:hypothetical protein [Scopulibacillus darangshiensis]TCP19931.1 hypothetical protein EV207_1575 [Scopulibacillus darangshiensis]